ncbi:MAG: glycosyltransferase family 4 protein [Flavobacteriaceae bacterium]
MKLGIITHASHKTFQKQLYAYEPYVREMNLWIKNADKVKVLAPLSKNSITEIDSAYASEAVILKKVPAFNLLTIKNKLAAIAKIPYITFSIFKVFFWADHIHIRCPGNFGLLACWVQILFPTKKKTVKYAGNWDPNSKQPFSYRLQKKILSNTFLTRNVKVLVYGEWQNQTKNIIPFFTASYSSSELVKVKSKSLEKQIKILFVGTLSENKRPILTVRAVHQLIDEGNIIVLNMFGDGSQRTEIEEYIKINKLEEHIILHGNQSKNRVKEAYLESHFLIFISKSEGWPKVVAEAMFWGCLPIVTKVSCVPYMIDEDQRGSLVDDNIDDIIKAFNMYLTNHQFYNESANRAMEWSQQYTLDKLAIEISYLFKN